MALQKTKTIDPVNVDTDGLSAAAAVAAAGNLTLGGALTSGGVYTADYPRQITIVSDGADNARTFTVTGTDPDGKAQTEAISGPNATTVESTKYWNTVTQIAVDDGCAGNISSGIVDELVTNTIPLDHYNSDGATVSIEQITGTIDITVQETFSDMVDETTFEWFDVSALTNKTAATRAQITTHATGVRFKVNSYTNGADFKGVVIQNRPR